MKKSPASNSEQSLWNLKLLFLLWYETELRGGQIKVAAACQQLRYLLFVWNRSRDLTHEWRPLCGICCLQAKQRLPKCFVLPQSPKHRVFTHQGGITGKFDVPIHRLSTFKHVFARQVNSTCASQFFISAVDNYYVRFQSSPIGFTCQGIQKKPWRITT